MICLNYCPFTWFLSLGKRCHRGLDQGSGGHGGLPPHCLQLKTMEQTNPHGLACYYRGKPVLNVPIVWPFSPDILCRLPCKTLCRTADSQFGLEERTLYEEFPHCQRKWSTWCWRLTCPAPSRRVFFRCGDRLFHSENCCFISGSPPQIQLSSAVMDLQRKFLTFLSWSCKSSLTGSWFCLQSFGKRSTNVAAYGLMLKIFI